MRYPDGRTTMLADFAYPEPDPACPDPAEEFHEAAKYSAASVATEFHPARMHFLSHHDAHARVGRPTLTHRGARIELPPPAQLHVDLGDVGRRRRSRLSNDGALSLDALATTLALGYGAPSDRGSRSCPSAGALYPFDLVVIPARVDGLDPAVHVYDPFEHCLWRQHDLDVDEFLAGATVAGQVLRPAAVVALVATFARTRAKYGVRGYRFVLLEAGHVAQTMLLTATALGIESLPWGGFADRFVDRSLDLDGVHQSCLYLLCLGGAHA